MLLFLIAYPLATTVAVVHPLMDAFQPFLTADSTARSLARGQQRAIVLLVEFPDKKHLTDAQIIRDMVFKDLDKFYREVSYGLMSITGNITNRWYQTQTPLSNLDLEEWAHSEEDMARFEREAIEAANKDVDYGRFDFAIIVAAGEVWPHAKCDFGVLTKDRAKPLRGIVVNEFAPLATYAHELGHVLPSNCEPRHGCGLPDLYSYEASEKGYDPNIFVGSWDIMGVSNAARHFSAWSKIELGWITPEVVHPGASIATPIVLEALEEDSGTRAIVVPTSYETSYVIEVRRQIGYDRSLPSEGILVYLIDMSKRDGYGPVRVIDSYPETPTLDDAPYKQGAVLADPTSDVHLAIAYVDGVGYFTLSAGNSPRSPTGTRGSDWWLAPLCNTLLPLSSIFVITRGFSLRSARPQQLALR